jgi:hypothetical protein
LTCSRQDIPSESGQGPASSQRPGTSRARYSANIQERLFDMRERSVHSFARSKNSASLMQGIPPTDAGAARSAVEAPHGRSCLEATSDPHHGVSLWADVRLRGLLLLGRHCDLGRGVLPCPGHHRSTAGHWRPNCNENTCSKGLRGAQPLRFGGFCGMRELNVCCDPHPGRPKQGWHPAALKNSLRQAGLRQ